ncbi:M24 family metallopeptidase [Arthrobacter sp. SD76]|uniref:M24 family metallopeptidase n=1 Tax=Arthrobacter sp. SD76 TaxID=3415007 RepID=UPI003C784496
MTTVELPELSIAERDRRWQIARRFMTDHDLSAILVTAADGPFRMQPYFANTSTGTILFPADSDPVWLGWLYDAGRVFENERRSIEPWIADTRIGFDALAEAAQIARERGLEGTRVGVLGISSSGIPMGGVLPYTTGKHMFDVFEGFELIDISSQWGSAIIARSPEELQFVRHAAKACEDATAALIEVAREGVPESELYAAVINTFAKAGAHATEPQVLLTVEPATMDFLAGPHWFFPRRQRRLLQRGDVIQVEMFCWFGGLDSQGQVTIVVGEPEPEQAELNEVARRAYEAGVAQVRPGARFTDVWEAMRQVILDAGCWSASPLVHTLSPVLNVGELHSGMMDADIDARLKTPAFVPGDFDQDWILEEGVTLAIEPCPARGYRKALVGGAVLVTADGAEELNDLPTHVHTVAAGVPA